MENAFEDIIKRHVSVRKQPTPERKKHLKLGLERHGYEDTDFNSDDMEVSSDDETAILKHSPTVTDLKQGLFIVVRFLYEAGTKKECSKKFVAKLDTLNKKSYTVSCLRRYKESKNMFVFPDVADMNRVEFGQIISVLKTPSIKRGLHIFSDNVDLSLDKLC
ncbi:hypothetical protein JTB14_026242 [Gonioctena quinquepunctata]|nr:hypothetical protein JTB14_026242 [Gonioctena quinquepunctata]